VNQEGGRVYALVGLCGLVVLRPDFPFPTVLTVLSTNSAGTSAGLFFVFLSGRFELGMIPVAGDADDSCLKRSNLELDWDWKWERVISHLIQYSVRDCDLSDGYGTRRACGVYT
jgi:hypothetical protein